MARFVARSLATWSASEGADALILHDLQRDLIRKRREKELPDLHRRVVEGWGDLLKLPDTYAWHWAPWHLKQAGWTAELRQLLLDLDWLQAKLEANDVNALIVDFGLAPEEADLRLVQGAIRLSAHVLVHDKHQLPGQLTGRLLGSEKPEIETLVAMAGEWRGSPWLRPIRRSLTPPGGPLIRTLEGHTYRVNAVAVTADGRRAVSASDDTTLRIWDLESGKLFNTFAADSQLVACAVTPNGRTFVAGDSSGQVHFLRLIEPDKTMRPASGTKTLIFGRKNLPA